MHIIFDENVIDQLKQNNNHTILPLDTIRPSPDSEKTLTAYCVVSTIPLTEIGQTEAYVQWHNELLLAYKHKNWQECVTTLNLLAGKFNGELDTFYNELRERIRIFIKNPPPETWDGVYEPWNNPTHIT